MSEGGRLALIIASSEFSDPTLKRLITPGKDATELARVLENRNIGNFKVKTLINRPYVEIQSKIEDLFAECTRDDLVLLYFSGHGIKDDDGRLYLAATDTRRNRLRSSAISTNFINENMTDSRSRQQILILDCCHSGAFARGMTAKGGDSVDIKERFQGYGRIVLTASNSTQYAFQGDEVIGEAQKSVFTRYLVSGLETGNADYNNDGWISLKELYDFVRDNVVKETPLQTPGMWVFDLQGDIRIATTPRGRRKKPVDEAKLATLYADAYFAFTSGKWKEALNIFEQIENLSPGYRDVAIQIERLKPVVYALEDQDNIAASPQVTTPPEIETPVQESISHKKEFILDWAPIIGIDFGTSKSTMAFIDSKGEALVIPSSGNDAFLPSVVEIKSNNTLIVGAKHKNPSTLCSIKRLLGRKFDDVQDILKRVPNHPFIKARNGDVAVGCNDQEFVLQEIVAMILRKLKDDAENYLGSQINKAVIAVPSYFNDIQRRAIIDSGSIAGLEILRIINDPTAASMAYGVNIKSDETTVVYAFGGGTCSCSIINIGDGVFDVKSTAGDIFLGGDDFDQVIVDYLVKEFRKESGIDLRNDHQAIIRLSEAAENAKIKLSTTVHTEINLPYLTADASGPKHLVMTLSRSKLEQITSDLVNRAIIPVKQALKDSELEVSAIEKIIMIGGMSKMPAIQKKVADFFGKQPLVKSDTEGLVAQGAALLAGILGGKVKDMLYLDVTSLSLGVETLGEVMTVMIPRNTTIPVRKTEIYSTAADNQVAVDIHVLQGERPMASDNLSLGRFRLDGIPPAPHGTPQIEVTLDIDANSILKVTAKDKATGKQQNVTITSPSGLSKSEVEHLRQKVLRYKI